VPYEVDNADGLCLYRGRDLELACEIHDQTRSAHLVILTSTRPAGTGAGPQLPWKGPTLVPAR
jgi:hypothetical protein